MLNIYTKDLMGSFKNIEDKVDKLAEIGVSYSRVELDGSYIGEIKFLHNVPFHDIITVTEETENYTELRNKFKREHTHDDFEMRLFTHGTASFFISANDLIYELVVGPNDLISIPAHTKHWFDAGDNPNFSAVRFFTDEDGWIAKYTDEKSA